MIDQEKVRRGDVLHLHGKVVTVLAINRFWNRAGGLIAGAIMLSGDPVARTPRSLRTFCEQAQRPLR